MAGARADSKRSGGARICPTGTRCIRLFEGLVLLRRFESVAQVACRKGETPGFLHLYIGEEATGVGVCAHLAADRLGHIDAPRPRPRAGQGGRPEAGDGRALRQGGRHLRRPRRHHASLRPHGRAVRHQRHRRRRHRARGRHRARRARRRAATTSASPSSATAPANHGAFHEALNFAAVQRAPAVFVCENNLYATATPLSTITLNPEIATKAASYGMPGVAVDGNDVLAVWTAMREATERARRRRRADADRGQDLPHGRPPRGRPGGRHLPHPGGDRRLGEARPGRHVPPPAARGLPRRDAPTSWRRSRRGSRRWSSEALDFARSSPEPDPATVRRHVYADPINPPEALRPAAGGDDRGAGLARRGARRHRRGDAGEPGHPLFRRGHRRARRQLRPHQGPLAGVRARADGRHADLRAGLHRRRGRRLGHRRAHGLGPDVRRLRLRDGRADLPAGREAALHEQRRRSARRWWCGSAPGRCAAPGRTTAAAIIRSSRTCRGSSSACPRRRPTPRG